MNATELQEVVDEFFLVEKDWNEEDHPRDEIGRFTWAGGGGVAGKLANLIRVAGGFTYQPVTDSQPKTGKMVGKPGHEKQIKGIPKAEQIKAYLDENAAEFKDPDAYCGGWHNPEDDTTYLDISERYETDEEAAAASIAAHQEAYYDLATGETTYVRAREAERLEAKARLVQARNVAGGDPADHRRDLGDRSPEDRWGALRAILLKEFDPNQPRDERGQWTSDGGVSVDQRIADAEGRGVVSASRVPFGKPAFITENDRVVYNTRGGFRSHDGNGFMQPFPLSYQADGNARPAVITTPTSIRPRPVAFDLRVPHLLILHFGFGERREWLSHRTTSITNTATAPPKRVPSKMPRTSAPYITGLKSMSIHLSFHRSEPRQHERASAFRSGGRNIPTSAA